jgi:hypothetical protein
MKKYLSCILLFIGFISLNLYGQAMSNDEIEIKAIIDKYTLMWTTDSGVDLFKSFSSDKFQFYGPNQVLSRNQFLVLLTNVLAGSRPDKHIHTTRKLIINGSIAFEYANLKMIMKDGTINEQETINVFSKETNGWKVWTSPDLMESQAKPPFSMPPTVACSQAVNESESDCSMPRCIRKPPLVLLDGYSCRRRW